MKKLFLLISIMITAAFILTACGTDTPEAAATMAAEAVISQPSGLIAEGRLEPVNALDQSFSISGKAAEVLVKDGESVVKGQVLARLTDVPETALALARAQQETLAAQQAMDELKASAEVTLAQEELSVIAAQKALEAAQEKFDGDESDENRAELDAAKAALKLAKENQKKLVSGDGVNPEQLALIKASLVTAEAAVASAQAAIDARELKASIDGTLVDVNLQAGQQITAGQTVMTLADFTSWVVKTDNLTEAEVVDVKEGQKVEVVLDALPDVTLNGVVKQINSRYEEKRGDITFTVTIALNETDPLMRWGMTAAVHFVP